MVEIDRALSEAKVIVLLLSRNAVRSPWVRREITNAVGRGCVVLPLKIQEFELPRDFRFLLSHHQWLDAPEGGFAEHHDQIIARIREELLREAAPVGDVDNASAPGVLDAIDTAGASPKRSPYAGPAPFNTGMAGSFFGRHKDAEQLLHLLASCRAVLLFAPSGAGKTSLLQTLICRGMEDRGFEVMLRARVGGALPSNVKSKSIANVFTFSLIFGLSDGARLDPTWRLTDFLSTWRGKSGAVGRLLILDQFEELFTQHPDRFKDRAGFFEEVAEALGADPSLRVVFAIRQEYLADFEMLAGAVGGGLEVQRFLLGRLGTEGALEAITRPAAPFARYAPGVAETIVKQLKTIRMVGFDGEVVEKPGEYLELVHLQIVCDRLWRSLPEGTKLIEIGHVERAAGEGLSVNEFVVNALDAFYDETVEKIAGSDITRAHGTFPRELIQLGCMKFVTTASTRTMVPRTNGRTGRLPDWIVEQLEDSHLLRVEYRGGERWYELAHDRLAEPVARKMDRQVTALLFASDLLNKVLERVLEQRGSLRGYFAEHRDILVESRPFHQQVGLFQDEAEFAFRASLATGQDMTEWSRRLASDYPDVRKAVLMDAFDNGTMEIRRHAASVLGEGQLDDPSQLVEAVLSDPDEPVRRAAAVSLARIDSTAAYDPMFAALRTPQSRARALECLARVRACADVELRAPSFEGRFMELSQRERRRVRAMSRRMRLRERLPVLAFVFVPAALLAATAAALFKWLPGLAGWAICQAEPSAAMGVFHGVIAGVVWAGFITLGITFNNVVFVRQHDGNGRLVPVSTLVAGAVSGFVSSALIVVIVATVYRPESLLEMGWLASAGEASLARLYREIFVETRFGWVYLVTGTGLGLAMALTANSLRASEAWREFYRSQDGRIEGFDEINRVLRQIMRIVAPHAWLLPVVVALFSIGAFAVPDLSLPADERFRPRGNPTALVEGLIGDGLTQAIGAYFGICGMAFGLILMRRGLHFDPRRQD